MGSARAYITTAHRTAATDRTAAQGEVDDDTHFADATLICADRYMLDLAD